jgi:hypothetical protein
MDLTFNEADFLMHCIELFAANSTSDFLDDELKTVCLTSDQITDLFLRIQEAKFIHN